MRALSFLPLARASLAQRGLGVGEIRAVNEFLSEESSPTEPDFISLQRFESEH